MFNADKDYRGVVSKNSLGVSVYSGDPSFSPIGRDDFTRTASGGYSISASKDNNNGGNDSPTEEVISPAPKDMTTRKSPSISTASRRALISGAGGSALRRNLL